MSEVLVTLVGVKYSSEKSEPGEEEKASTKCRALFMGRAIEQKV
jgi:hypothetical protein